MNHLSIFLFGRFRVFKDEEEVTGFRMHKVRALLIYLAAAPDEAHRRETLMMLLWPGMPEQSARSNLRQVLFHLRQTIPDFEPNEASGAEKAVPLIIANRHIIQLNPQANIEIDTDRFNDFLQQTITHDHVDFLACRICQQNLTSAAEIYKGDFLADFYLEDSNEFEEWAEVTRQSYRRKILDALESLAAFNTRQKVYNDARTYALRQLEIDNLRESAYRQLMEILALNGQRAEALSYYEGYRRLLAEELGMAPSKRTADLYKRIQSGDIQFDKRREQDVRGYDLKEEIGEGAYGIIHRGVQAAIGREVAIKIIRRRYANDPAFIRRFETEAQIIARLEHPHIVPLYDYWREPEGAFLVMRLLRGGNLLAAMDQGPWSPERVQKLLGQIAPALDAAHRQGIVHRDIKPANILFDESGNGYLSDFGIAKDLADNRQLTLGEAFKGTPDYVSPEQLQESPVSHQSDIYSLGAILYELLTGEKPFPNMPLVTVIQSHITAPFPLVSSCIPDLPVQIDSVIQKATAKDPDDRYDDVLIMAEAFRLAIHGRSLNQVIVPGVTSVDESEVVNPYKGLRPFQEADALDFYGREALVGQLVNHVAKSRFLAVVGPSGSGKSSVVKAGLTPALRQGTLPDSEKWYVAEMVPGTHPLEELELALWPIAVDPPPSLVEPMQRDSRGMLRTIRRIMPNEEDAQLLLIIDQFEELFTQVDAARRNHFLDSLFAAINSPRTPLRVIVTLRADFYDQPLQHQPLADLFKRNTELVLPLNRDELTWAIQEPARRAGAAFGDGVVAAIVADVTNQPGALPMMQYALTELFDARRNHTLTLQAYKDIGGVSGAIARRADEIYGRLTPEEQHSARQLFLRLISLGEGVEDTKRRVRTRELEELDLDNAAEAVGQLPISGVIAQFGKARLLTFDRDPLTREPTVEVAHEALLREWNQLRSWLDEYRTDIRQQRSLASAASSWLEAGRDEGHLLRGARLSQFEGWHQVTEISLTHTEQAYLEASFDARKIRHKAEEARRQRELKTAQQLVESERQRAEDQEEAAGRLRRRAYLLVGALFIVLILALLALYTGQQAIDNAAVAERSAAESSSLALASGAQAALANSDTDQALALALAANQLENPPAFAQQMLYEAAYAPGTIQRINGGGQFRWAMDVHPNSQIVASAAHDGTISLYDVDTGAEEMLLSGGHTEPLGGVAFTPDGEQLLSGAFDDTLLLWDLESSEIIRRMENPSGDVNAVAVSADGKQGIAASELGVATLWNLETGELIGELAGHDPELQLQGVDFSPDGRLAATASEDAAVIIWDLSSLSIVHNLQGHENIVFDVAFSPDGKTLASAGFDNLVKLWDVSTGELISNLEGHKDFVFDVDFNSDGTRLLSSSRDQTTILWDVAGAKPIQNYLGEAGRIFSIGFLDEERGISTASTGNLRQWALHDQRIQKQVPLTDNFMASFTQSHDGRLAAVGLQEKIEVWDLHSDEILHTLPVAALGHFPLATGEVTSLAFNEDGSRLLAGNDEGLIILWDLSREEEISRFEGHLDDTYLHSARILDLTFSPDDSQFLSSSDDKSMILWDIDTGEIQFRYSSPSDTINAVVFSPDGHTVAGGSGTYRYLVEGDYEDNNIHLWDAESGEGINQITGHMGPVTALRFSIDGQQLLSGSVDETVRLWDIESGQQIRRFDGHNGGIFDLDFSADGRYGASASVDGSVIIWDLENGDLLRQLVEHEGLVHHVQFSEDGNKVWSAAEDAQAILWNLTLDLNELRHWAEDNRFLSEFTCNQRVQYQIEPLCTDS